MHVDFPTTDRTNKLIFVIKTKFRNSFLVFGFDEIWARFLANCSEIWILRIMIGFQDRFYSVSLKQYSNKTISNNFPT